MAETAFAIKGIICHAPRADAAEIRENAYAVCTDGICRGVFDELPEAFSGTVAIEMFVAISSESEEEKAPWNLYFAYAALGKDPAAFHLVMNRTRCTGSFGDLAYPALPLDRFVRVRMLIDTAKRTLLLQVGNNRPAKYTNIKAPALAPGRFALGDAGDSVGRIFDLKSMKIGVVK